MRGFFRFTRRMRPVEFRRILLQGEPCRTIGGSRFFAGLRRRPLRFERQIRLATAKKFDIDRCQKVGVDQRAV